MEEVSKANPKRAVLAVLEILKKYTDENHPISNAEIRKMTIKIVMGTAFSGKTYFIKEKFLDSEILSVGEYQRRIKDKMGTEKYIPIDEQIKILERVNDQIKNDMVESISQGKIVICVHTPVQEKLRFCIMVNTT